LRQAWELSDADTETLIRNFTQRHEQDWSRVSGSVLGGIDEILVVTRL
jgi:putative transposase